MLILFFIHILRVLLTLNFSVFFTTFLTIHLSIYPPISVLTTFSAVSLILHHINFQLLLLSICYIGFYFLFDSFVNIQIFSDFCINNKDALFDSFCFKSLPFVFFAREKQKRKIHNQINNQRNVCMYVSGREIVDKKHHFRNFQRSN